MSEYVDANENHQDLIEVADIDSVTVGAIQNGSNGGGTNASIMEYSELNIQ